MKVSNQKRAGITRKVVPAVLVVARVGTAHEGRDCIDDGNTNSWNSISGVQVLGTLP
jgi:hypothetical protein